MTEMKCSKVDYLEIKKKKAECFLREKNQFFQREKPPGLRSSNQCNSSFFKCLDEFCMYALLSLNDQTFSSKKKKTMVIPMD